MPLVFDTSLYMNGVPGGSVDESRIIVKSATIPTAGEDYVGSIYMYVGETNSTYTHGYIYECVESGSTYAWERIDVQPGATRGRFLALWNCETGLAESNPPSSPYPYGTGDYYIVGTVGTTNYKPSGSSYVIGTASTKVETEDVAVNDTYYYDGTNWNLQKNTVTEYVAGTGISINNKTISVASPTLTNTAVNTTSVSIIGTSNGARNQVVIGSGANGGNSNNSVVIGYGADNNTQSSDNVLIGYNAKNSGNNVYQSTIIGKQSATNEANRNTVIGANSVASTCSIAIGPSATASGMYSVSIGQNSHATGANSIAIGTSAQATAQGAIQIGGKTNTDPNTLYCGIYGYNNWKLLDLTTGKIPADRLPAIAPSIDNTTITKNSSDQLQASAVINARTGTDVMPIWQGTEQQWTNGKATDWYSWRTNATFGVKQTNNFLSVQDLTSIVSDQNIYIGYKYNTTSYIYSTDGVNWSSGTFPSPVGYCRSVDNGFIFTNESDDSKIMFSSDGINWTEVTLTSATWGDCAYGNGTYVLINTRKGAGKVAISQNGIDWTIQTLYSSSANRITGIAFGNGTFVAVHDIVGGQQLYYSEDNGSTWKADYNINPSYKMGYPVFSKGKFVVTGYNSNKAAYSTDGKNWTTVDLPSSGAWYLNRATENAFLIWATNTTKAAYSADGITWHSVSLPTVPSAYFPYSCFNKFIFKNGGKDLYYSSDGNNWASLDLGSNFASSTNIFNTCKKGMITASNTTTDYATLGDIFNQVYTLDTTPTTSSTVYSAPNTPSALTITSIGTGTITLSDNNTYTYTSSGDVTTYQTIGDAYPNYLANINGVGVKIGNTLIADYTNTATFQTTTNLVTSVSSSSTDTQYPSAKLLYDTVGNIEATLDAIIAQGSNS